MFGSLRLTDKQLQNSFSAGGPIVYETGVRACVIVFLVIFGCALGSCQSTKVDENRLLASRTSEALPSSYKQQSLPPAENLELRGVNHFYIPAEFGHIAMSRFDYGTNGHGPLILMCMGATENRYRSNFYYVQRAINEGDVITFDYPGYGQSEGKATTEHFDKAAGTIAQFIDSQSAITNRPVVVWGHSLGGFVCSEIAKRSRSVKGVVVETSAPNIDRVVAKGLPFFARPLAGAFVDDVMRGYDITRSLKGFSGPVLVLGATNDIILNVKLSRELAEGLSAQGNQIRYVEYPNVGHTNLYKAPGFRELIRNFMVQFRF